MRRCKINFVGAPGATLVVAFVLGAGFSAEAFADINLDVKVKGEKVGEITVGIRPSGNDQGLEGDFTVTKKKKDGKTMTIKELEKELKQDHLNWFQKVTSDNKPPKDSKGKPLKAPYIDPPKDGYSDQWADDIPWYWDEAARPPNEPRPWDPGYLLSNNVAGSVLDYEDFPGGAAGTHVEFVTFLISDFGNKIYDVLGGFAWNMTVNPQGFTKITALGGPAIFKSEFATEIKKDFGYTRIPAPGALLLGALGLGMVGAVKRRVAA